MTATDRTTEQVHSSATAGSIAGAEAIRPHAKTLGLRILDLLDQAREDGRVGLNNGELSALTGLRDMTVWPRVSALKSSGKLKDSRISRPSPATGNPMAVWVRTTPAEEAAVLAALKRDEVTGPPGKEARAAVTEILEGIDLGGLFTQREHLERVVQAAINGRSTAIRRAERKRREREEVAREN